MAQILSAGAEVNAADEDGRTPLHIACLHGNVEAVAQLLSAGAEANRADKTGHTPLHFITQKADPSLVRKLASLILHAFMRIQLQRLMSVDDANGRSQSFGFFGARTERFSLCRAVSVLNEYIQGRVEKSVLETHHDVYQQHFELSMIYSCYLAHPEMIEQQDAEISDLLKRHFEVQDSEHQIIALCSHDKNCLEAYLALALLRMENEGEKDGGESKFEAARLSVETLDPEFIEAKKILSRWRDENCAPSEKIDLLREKLKAGAIEPSDKGKEEEAEHSPRP